MYRIAKGNQVPLDPVKAKERARRYREKNRETMNARLRAWSSARRRAAGIPKRNPTPSEEDRKEYQRRWNTLNKDKRRDISQRYRELHPDKVAAYQKEYNAINQEQKKLKKRERDKTNNWWSSLSAKEKQKHYAKCRERYACNIEKSREYSRYRALMRRTRLAGGGFFSNADIEALYLKQGKMCANQACRKCITKHGDTKFHIDHIVPVSRGGSSWPDNLQLLCQTCNLSKGAKDPNEWARSHGLLFA